jgi:hypothetical protein
MILSDVISFEMRLKTRASTIQPTGFLGYRTASWASKISGCKEDRHLNLLPDRTHLHQEFSGLLGAGESLAQ